MIKFTEPIVSADWLLEHLSQKELIVIDATLKKAVDDASDVPLGVSIKTARFFDIKNTFSDTASPFPNTLLTPLEFQKKARELGIYKDSAIVVYDRYGYYSAPRVWWMFRMMGFSNIAVLDGGLPHWLKLEYPIQNSHVKNYEVGDFASECSVDLIHGYDRVLNAIDDKDVLILDARSNDRFLGTAPEPREGLRSGHIPTSKNLPYSSLLHGDNIKSREEIKQLFSEYSQQHFIFTCGSGITACILALGAEIAGIDSKSVYDGSWTEWGSLGELPIEVG